MTTSEEWDLINDEIMKITKLIQKSGLTMVSGTFGTNDGIDNWQYKIWIPKSKQKKITSLNKGNEK
jgi:hypothetical protein